jgi:hypothetical protein
VRHENHQFDPDKPDKSATGCYIFAHKSPFRVGKFLELPAACGREDAYGLIIFCSYSAESRISSAHLLH